MPDKTNTTTPWPLAAAARLQGLLPSLRTYQALRPYRWHPGFVAWLLHRLTGLGLAAYILLHLYVLQNLARGPEQFNSLMAAFSHPIFKLMEIGLLGVVAYHTINGLRIVLMDYGPLAEKEHYKKYLAGTFAVIAVAVGLGGAIMFGHIISGLMK
ncbi:MAG: succinate dehydrogenase, cytochrome b556 subunit [Thermodesulfobacteriota bacterium]